MSMIARLADAHKPIRLADLPRKARRPRPITRPRPRPSLNPCLCLPASPYGIAWTKDMAASRDQSAREVHHAELVEAGGVEFARSFV